MEAAACRSSASGSELTSPTIRKLIATLALTSAPRSDRGASRRKTQRLHRQSCDHLAEAGQWRYERPHDDRECRQGQPAPDDLRQPSAWGPGEKDHRRNLKLGTEIKALRNRKEPSRLRAVESASTGFEDRSASAPPRSRPAPSVEEIEAVSSPQVRRLLFGYRRQAKYL